MTTRTRTGASGKAETQAAKSSRDMAELGVRTAARQQALQA